MATGRNTVMCTYVTYMLHYFYKRKADKADTTANAQSATEDEIDVLRST